MSARVPYCVEPDDHRLGEPIPETTVEPTHARQRFYESMPLAFNEAVSSRCALFGPVLATLAAHGRMTDGESNRRYCSLACPVRSRPKSGSARRALMTAEKDASSGELGLSDAANPARLWANSYAEVSL